MSKEQEPSDALIRSALLEEDADAAWSFVSRLHETGTFEVVTKASSLSQSAKPRERKLAADILGQLGVPTRTYPDECIELLLEMLRGEQDPDVLESIAVALGHQNTERAVEALAPFRTHPSADVRSGVAFGILGLRSQEAIDLLLSLMDDIDAEVRDWATFGVGTILDSDSPAIREGLHARLLDEDADVRAEAIVGLARRKDTTIMPLIIAQLSEEEVHPLSIDAAAEAANATLYPALIALQKRTERTNVDGISVLDIQRAIDACSGK